MILSLNDVCKNFGDKVILDHINLSVDEKDRIGLIGVNGAGKTTLLNIICKNTDCDKGEVGTKNGLSIGYLHQNSGLDKNSTIWEEMRVVFAPLLEVENKLRELEKRLSIQVVHGEQYHQLSKEYAKLSEYFEQNEGYHIDVKIKTILNGMGFGDKSYSTVISTLSGGEKTRLALARLLLEQPQLLILDEPTNHLDFKTLLWLEDYLCGYKGALLVVSHDRYFLDKMVSTIWEVDRTRLCVYRGNYSKYKLLKQERIERQQKEYEIQQQQIASMKEYAEKNIARVSTSNSAKSRLHQLANMELIEKPLSELKAPAFRFDYDKESVKDALSVKDLSLSVGEGGARKILLQDISFEVKRGDKVAIIGANGIGKSTLLKSILGFLPQKGDIVWGKHVQTSYYEQENQNLDFKNTVLEELWSRFPKTPEHKIRAMLGRMLITDDNAYKKVSVISGGERARLGFAIMLMQRANTLIFDEPTNHLDLPSKEALEQSLREFSGTLLFVSHDRYFLNTIPNKIFELDRDGLKVYNGNFDDYMESKKQAA
ncbi:MAG: transporter ATPase component, partial [Oscillospiraceae bacterium]|nr:transporter ATPase component [Oscillospiraceae bacterium]